MFAVCSECGLVGECILLIVPGAEMDQDHIYVFRCGSCENEISKTRYAGSSIGYNPVTICPFCGCDSGDHSLGQTEPICR